jgi:hypothetical protein
LYRQHDKMLVVIINLAMSYRKIILHSCESHSNCMMECWPQHPRWQYNELLLDLDVYVLLLRVRQGKGKQIEFGLYYRWLVSIR